MQWHQSDTSADSSSTCGAPPSTPLAQALLQARLPLRERTLRPGWFDTLAHVLLGAQCQVCDTEVGAGVVVCARCLSRWSLVERHCTRCGQQGAGAGCERCTIREPPWSQACTLTIYEEGSAQTLRALKYQDQPKLAHAVGHLMGLRWAQLHPPLLGACPMLLTWVPVSRARLRSRGFDQARRLARGVGWALNLRPTPTLLRRSRSTQSEHGRARRAENTAGAFVVACRVAVIVGRDVLLVDDVLTTGATAEVCASALLAAGARSVHLLTFARAA